MERAICVYCSSSNAVDEAHFVAARELGRAMAQTGFALVYGGTNVGLMGALAESVHAHGGKVIGVIPMALKERGIGYDRADELIVTPDMRSRKAKMAELASAFVGLPGGFGTLEEILETITLKQLSYHDKPVALLNVAGFYDPLHHLFEHVYEHRFAKPEYRALYHIAPDVDSLLTYLERYQPPDLQVNKWF